MPRPNKPWFWKARGEWFVKIGGVRHRLGADKDEAFRRFHGLLSKPPEIVPSGSVAEITELFMDWTQANRPKSYDWYRARIARFYALIKDLPVCQLRPYHVQRELDKHGWSEAYKAGCVTAVKRIFNWAVEQGHIDRSPLHGLKKPHANLSRDPEYLRAQAARRSDGS